MNKAILCLEDGTVFQGTSLGAQGTTIGEVVFNTAMTGYQEILTDPSYAGQIVTMTYPLIGNYGVNEEDVESSKIHLKGFVVKEFCRYHSNFRANKSLIEYLDENNIIAIEGVDTRAITRHIREKGAMKCAISNVELDSAVLVEKMKDVPSMEGSDWVKEVTTSKEYIWHKDESVETKYKLAVIDCGVKFNILRIFESLGCEVNVFPSKTTAEEIAAIDPDGIFVSNGPGDPAAVISVIETVKALIGKYPVFGICLGHQIIGLALGGKTYKLKFGHHGANHPVQDSVYNRIGITSQNHGFCVDIDSLGEDVEIINVNLNDQTMEGMRHKKLPVVSFQHHPEAAPGPHDVQYLFEYFVGLMGKDTCN